jgi:hypothetical protein
MTFQPHSRRILKLALATVLLSEITAIAAAQPAFMHRTGQAGRPAMSAPRPGPGAKQNGMKQEHLAQWMDRHSNLPLAEQQKALENEPGFRDLPPQTQQRMHDKITQLNNMPPERRRRILERAEEFEHLTPAQRQQWRGAMQQYTVLPENRRRVIARAFRDLREMPQPQRDAILNSDRFRGQFSDQERGMLSSLLSVEPYISVQHPNEGPSFGK